MMSKTGPIKGKDSGKGKGGKKREIGAKIDMYAGSKGGEQPRSDNGQFRGFGMKSG